jgi:hypothetical protein
MRLFPQLVRYMAETVVGELLASKLVEVDNRGRIAGVVENIILADLEREEQLEEEARELLNRHYEQVRASGAEYYELFRKVKEKLAKEKGIIL